MLVMLALIAQCFPTGLLNLIVDAVRKRKTHKQLWSNLNSIELQFQQQYGEWLEFDDMIKQYEAANGDYNYWMKKEKNMVKK